MNEMERVLDKLDRMDDRLVHQGEALVRLATQMESYVKSFAEHEKEDERTRKKVEELSKWRWTVLGALSVLTLVGQWVAKRLGI